MQHLAVKEPDICLKQESKWMIVCSITARCAKGDDASAAPKWSIKLVSAGCVSQPHQHKQNQVTHWNLSQITFQNRQFNINYEFCLKTDQFLICWLEWKWNFWQCLHATHRHMAGSISCLKLNARKSRLSMRYESPLYNKEERSSHIIPIQNTENLCRIVQYIFFPGH